MHASYAQSSWSAHGYCNPLKQIHGRTLFGSRRMTLANRYCEPGAGSSGEGWLSCTCIQNYCLDYSYERAPPKDIPLNFIIRSTIKNKTSSIWRRGCPTKRVELSLLATVCPTIQSCNLIRCPKLLYGNCAQELSKLSLSKQDSSQPDLRNVVRLNKHSLRRE